jgi:hypothetical protein
VLAVGISVTLMLLSVISNGTAMGICSAVAALGTVALGVYLSKTLEK